GDIYYNDADTLTVGSVTDPRPAGAPTNGITTGGNDLYLQTGGALAINQAIVAGAGTVLLNVTAGGATQTAAITGTNLLLLGTGLFDLQNAGNDVDTIAANITGGDLYFRDTDGLNVGSATDPRPGSPLGTTNGITTGGNDLALLTGNTITINQPINVGAGVVMMNTTAGGVNQVAGAITGASILLIGTGTFNLPLNTNDVDTIAANITGALTYHDADGLTIGSVTDPRPAGTPTNGITATSGNVIVEAGKGAAVSALVVNQQVQTLTSGDITLRTDEHAGAGDNLTVNANVDSADGNVLLQAGDNINQSTGTVIRARGLGDTVTLNAAQGDTDAIGGITQTGTAVVRSNYGNITLTARDAILLTLLDARNATGVPGNGDAVVTSSNGNIEDSDLGTVPADLDIIAHNVNLSAPNGNIGVTGGTFDPGEEIDIQMSGLLTVNAGTNAYLGFLGDVILGNITAPNIVNIMSTGNIFDDSNEGTDISAGTIYLTAADDIGATDGLAGVRPGFIDIDVTSLVGTGGGANSIWLIAGVGDDIYLNFLNGDFHSSFFDDGTPPPAVNGISPNNAVNSINSLTIGVSEGNNIIVDNNIFSVDDQGNPPNIYYTLNLLSTGDVFINYDIIIDDSLLTLAYNQNLTIAGGVTIGFVNPDPTETQTLLIWADSDQTPPGGALNIGNPGNRTIFQNVENLILIASDGIAVYSDSTSAQNGDINVAIFNSTSGDIIFDNLGDIVIFDGQSWMNQGFPPFDVDFSAIGIDINGINNYWGGNITIIAHSNVFINAPIHSNNPATCIPPFGCAGGNVTVSATESIIHGNSNGDVFTYGGYYWATFDSDPFDLLTGSYIMFDNGVNPSVIDTRDFAGNAGDVLIEAAFNGGQDITVSQIIANDTGNTSSVSLITYNGLISNYTPLGETGGFDITADELILNAATGIYLVDRSEMAAPYPPSLLPMMPYTISIPVISVSNLDAYNGLSGDVVIANAAPTPGGLTITDLGLGGGITNAGGGIYVVEDSSVNILTPVMGTTFVLIIANDSIPDNGNIFVNAPVSNSDAGGFVALYAAHNITINDDITSPGVAYLEADSPGIMYPVSDGAQGSGAIIQGSPLARVTATNLFLYGQAIGALGNPILTEADDLVAWAGSPITVGVAGGIYISELDSIKLTDLSTVDGDIEVTSGGDMEVDTLIAGGTNYIWLDSGGVINQTTAAVGTGIIADEFRFDAAGTVTLNNINNDVNTIAGQTTSGDIQYTDTDDLIIGTVQGLPGLATNGGNITVISYVNVGGNIDINQNIASAGGDITISTPDDINQATGTTVNSSGGNIEFQADSNDGSYGGIYQTGTASIVSGGGDITLMAGLTSSGGDNIEITLVDAGTGNAYIITHDDGAIVDNDAVDDNDIVATNLTLEAVNGIGDADEIDTMVSYLKATNTNNGIWIVNDGALTLTNFGSGNAVTNTNGWVEIYASSPLTVASAVVFGDDITDYIILQATEDGGSDDDLTISADVLNTGGGLITLRAGHDIIQTTGTIATTNGIVMEADYDAGTGGIINQTGGNITCDALTATAYGSITLDQIGNDFNTVTAHAYSAGGIILRDDDDVTLTDVDTANGPITVTANGLITATDVRSLTDNDANDITLTGIGILVGYIAAGNTGDV
ncbi:MAG: hypothetical protein AB1423_16050, partial [Pseudomonadota bacterium]